MGSNWEGECNIIGCHAPMVRSGMEWQYCDGHQQLSDRESAHTNGAFKEQEATMSAKTLGIDGLGVQAIAHEDGSIQIEPCVTFAEKLATYDVASRKNKQHGHRRTADLLVPPADERIAHAVNLVERFGDQCVVGRHKQWLIDQMLRKLLGTIEYDRWMTRTQTADLSKRDVGVAPWEET